MLNFYKRSYIFKPVALTICYTSDLTNCAVMESVHIVDPRMMLPISNLTSVVFYGRPNVLRLSNLILYPACNILLHLYILPIIFCLIIYRACNYLPYVRKLTILY